MSYFEQVLSDIHTPRGCKPCEGKVLETNKARLDLSSAKPRIELVFNPDLRRPVAETTIFPLRAIAHLLIDVGTSVPEYATGWFLSPGVVVTAAHALSYINNVGRLVLTEHVRVIPGRNGNTPPPFGVYDSTKIRVSDGWLQNREINTDYGAIHLSQPVGNQVGWFGIGIFTDEQIAASSFNLVGYPFDKQPLGSMWGETGSAVPKADQIAYTMSSYSGQSGCPLYAVAGGHPWVAGIHSNGQGAANYAVRITQIVLDELTSWKD